MEKKCKLFGAVMAAGLFLGLGACEPMEDDYWNDNSLIRLDWGEANPETGRRPVEVDTLNIHWFTQTSDINEPIVHEIKGSSQNFQIPTDIYDIMALQPDKYLTRKEAFKTITYELPTHHNKMGERVISEVPERMSYVGKITGEKLDAAVPQQTYITMERVLKKLNFVVVVEETAELTRPAVVDMSGMAYRKKLWNMNIAKLDEAVQVFNLPKHGRYLNDDRCLSAFVGSTYCLGTCGRNVLYLTLVDAENKSVVLKYDVTSYLSDWNTFEETVHIRINLVGDESQFYIDGWDIGNTTDIIFDYQMNGEV